MAEAHFRWLNADDQDSQNVIAGFRFFVWPGALGLIVLTAAWFAFGWPLKILASIAAAWVFSQFWFRADAFGKDVGDALGKMLALWRDWRGRVKPAAPVAVQGFANVAAAASEARPAPRIEWRAGLSRLFKALPLILALVLILALGLAVKNCAGDALDWAGLGRQTAAEVRADHRADTAEAHTRAAEAGAEQAERGAQRLDQRHTRIDATEEATHEAREAIQAAPDLEARIAAHRSFVDELRDSDAAARAAAVQDYRASLDP